MTERVLAELDALGDGFANSIYLGDQIVGRSGRAAGHSRRSGRHVVSLKFGNSRCDRAWDGQIESGPGGSTAESAEDLVRIVLVVKRELTELDALCDGSANSIYLGDEIVSRFSRVTGHPGRCGHHIEDLGFRKSKR